MIEQEIKRILHIVGTMTIGDSGTIRLKDVLSSDIPRGIKSHLAAEVVRWLRDDVRTTEHFRRLDPSSSAVPQIMKSFLRSLSSEYEFQRDEFLSVIHSGVHLAGNYLCRPQETLTQFVFQNRDRVSHEELTNSCDHFVDYGYLVTLLDSYLVKNAMTEISLSHFRLLISRLDERVVREHNARELAKLVKPLFDFLLFGGSGPADTIPLEPILAFFDDKKMVILREYIERICVIRGKSALSRKELTGIIEDLYEDDDAPTLGLLRGAQSRREETRPPGQAPGKQATEEPAEQTAPAGGSEGREQESPETTEMTLVSPDSPDGMAAGVDSQGSIITDPDSTAATSSAPEDGTSESLVDLHTLISKDRRAAFIKKIFEKDESYYESILQSLNAAPTWREASQNLNDLFQLNSIDPFTAIVVEFTDTIHSRYLPSTPP